MSFVVTQDQLAMEIYFLSRQIWVIRLTQLRNKTIIQFKSVAIAIFFRSIKNFRCDAKTCFKSITKKWADFHSPVTRKKFSSISSHALWIDIGNIFSTNKHRRLRLTQNQQWHMNLSFKNLHFWMLKTFCSIW